MAHPIAHASTPCSENVTRIRILLGDAVTRLGWLHYGRVPHPSRPRETGVKMNEWKEKYLGVVVGAVLIALGAFALVVFHWLFHFALIGAIAEALVVAGILVMVVDPYVKKRLLREAAKDILGYLLAYQLPAEVKERIQSLVTETKLYRRDMELEYVIREDGKDLVVEVENRFSLINPTSSDIAFRQLLQFEKAERATLRRVYFTPDKGRGEYDLRGETLKPRKGEPEVEEFEGDKVMIGPERDGVRYRFGASYTMRFSRGFTSGFILQNFGYPTIGVTVRVKGKPDNLTVTASPADKQSAGEWIYSRLFMPGDHIQLRWNEAEK